MLLWLANLISALTPQTRLFALRRWCYVRAGIKVAKTAKICGTARINGRVEIGEDFWVGAGAHLVGTDKSPIVLEDRCDLGPGVTLVVGSHEVGTSHRRAGKGTSAPIHIGEGSWIGARVTAIAGTTLGAGSVVGACTLLRGEYPQNSLVLGVPGKVVRTLEE